MAVAITADTPPNPYFSRCILYHRIKIKEANEARRLCSRQRYDYPAPNIGFARHQRVHVAQRHTPLAMLTVRIIALRLIVATLVLRMQAPV